MKHERMVDLHTHVLPCMDDGSSSIEESLQLLRELSSQGVTTVAATSHYYADMEKPSEFFEKRQKSFLALQERLDVPMTIYLGAEVYYYPGISLTRELPSFVIGTTKFLLLEMPFSDWTLSIVNEAIAIQRDRKLQVVIAHVDRYYNHKNKKYIENMLDYGILFQINAGAFLDRARRRDALSLLKKRAIHFIGSDCHNMTSRPPRIEEAFAVIDKKLGNEASQWLVDHANAFLEGAIDSEYSIF